MKIVLGELDDLLRVRGAHAEIRKAFINRSKPASPLYEKVERANVEVQVVAMFE